MVNKQFPILNTKETIPWEVIEKHRDQAWINHGQTLETLAARGGLDWYELQCVLSDIGFARLTFISQEYSREVVMQIIKDRNESLRHLRECYAFHSGLRF